MAELLQGIGPAAYVRNLAASRRFYEELLGLEIARVMSEDAKNIAVAYKAGLSIWQVDHAYDVIFDQSSPRPDKLGCGIWVFSFETPQLEALAVRLKQAGVGFAQPLRELPWGQRAIRVYDPDGHIIDIGSPHRSLNC